MEVPGARHNLESIELDDFLELRKYFFSSRYHLDETVCLAPSDQPIFQKLRLTDLTEKNISENVDSSTVVSNIFARTPTNA
jgi:hypothetical protein